MSESAYSFSDGEPEAALYSLEEAEERAEEDLALALLDEELIKLARIDCPSFIQFVFGWPMQRCHSEWHDLLSLEDRVVLWAPVEHGKTSQLSGRIVWELGVNPNARIAVISNTAGLAIKILSTVKQHIQLNPRVQMIFPRLRPETRSRRFHAWHDDKIVVQRDDLDNKDYSVQAIGIGGGLIGSRFDRAYLDDVLDYENTRHEAVRVRTIEWFDSTVESRIVSDGSVAIIGNAWHNQDMMHVLARRPGWKAKRYDGIDMLWPDASRVAGKLCGWPKWRIEKARATWPALEFNRKIRNIAISRESEIFHLDAIEQCFLRDEPWDPPPLPEWPLYVGVDLNVKRGEARHETAFFIGREERGQKVVQSIIARNMDLSEIVSTFFYIERKYHPVLFLVENVQAQDYIVQLFRAGTLRMILGAAGGDEPIGAFDTLPRVEGFATGSNKNDPILGIRGMTIEFEQKRWRIPEHPETRKWAGQLLAFAPEDHPGDTLMASWLFSTAIQRYRRQRVMTRSVGARR